MADGGLIVTTVCLKICSILFLAFSSDLSGGGGGVLFYIFSGQPTLKIFVVIFKLVDQGPTLKSFIVVVFKKYPKNGAKSFAI